MSVLLAALGGACAGGVIVVSRWLRARRSEADVDPSSPKETTDGEPPAKAARAERLDGFVCQLGDVVMRPTGEEAWLAGGVVLNEDRPVAALFVAPEGARNRALFVCPMPNAALVWLEPLDAGAVLALGEPPTTLEFDGVRYERSRRRPLRPRRIGVGAPHFGEHVVVAEYAATGDERLLVLKAASTTCVYRGIALASGAFEVIASGESTL